MNRQIKFKVIRKDTFDDGVRYEVIGYESLWDGVWFASVDGENWGDGTYRPKGKTELIRAQYTGLKDKNGKEIYEGDVVRWNCWRDGREDGWKVGQIVWLPKELGFRIKENYVDFSPAIYQHIEVIGNIWENPELLKQK